VGPIGQQHQDQPPPQIDQERRAGETGVPERADRGEPAHERRLVQLHAQAVAGRTPRPVGYWSADGRFLALRVAGDPGRAESRLVVLDPATGARATVDDSAAEFVLPGGALASVRGQRGVTGRVRVEHDGAVRVIDLPFPIDANAECWCPAGLARVDLSRGMVARTLELPTGMLLADTGDGLLWRVSTPDAQTLVRHDPVTGARTVVTVAPANVVVAVPGEVLVYGE
jgi:hypothetical protein